MAGAPGKSGGPRAHSGGARAGAGRKPKQAAAKSANRKSANGVGAAKSATLEAQPNGGALKRTKAKPDAVPARDMLQYLQDVALGVVEASTVQVRAAIAAVQYTHTKKGDGGKKDEDAEKAKKAGAGKFAAAAPPKLVAAGGKKV